MRVSKLYENGGNPVVSFEFFPPRDEEAEEEFEKVVDDLATLKPDYMSVTFGAGGSTRDGSFQTVKKSIEEKNQPTVAYIAGYGLGPDEMTTVLDRYQELGIETIFVIRGDEPRNNGQFVSHPDCMHYASDMISFINENYDFDLGCAGYPEGHVQAESFEKDIEYLKTKVDNGAKYVVAQYFYDNNLFYEYVDKCREAGISVPIIPGIMPIYGVKMTENLATLCGATISDELRRGLKEASEGGKDAVMQFGIDFAVEQCRELLEKGVPGLHFYTMDRSQSVVGIVNCLKQENLL